MCDKGSTDSTHLHDRATSPKGKFSLSWTGRQIPRREDGASSRALPPCQGMDLTAFGSNHLRPAASRVVARDGIPAGLGEGTVQLMPTTPAAPTRGLRVQGVPWAQWLRTPPR